MGHKQILEDSVPLLSMPHNVPCPFPLEGSIQFAMDHRLAQVVGTGKAPHTSTASMDNGLLN